MSLPWVFGVSVLLRYLSELVSPFLFSVITIYSCHFLEFSGVFMNFLFTNWFWSQNCLLTFFFSWDGQVFKVFQIFSKFFLQNFCRIVSLDDVSGLSPSSAVFFLELNKFFGYFTFYLFLLLSLLRFVPLYYLKVFSF